MNFYRIGELGSFGTNCYVIESSQKNAILIDAPYNPQEIIDVLERRGLSLKMILLTHGHCDHIEALGGLCEKYGCEVYISAEDKPMLRDAALCMAEYFATPFEPFDGAKTIADGQELSLDDITVKVIATPGHSAGSVCFCAENVIFTGDTLFNYSIGRTDLGGSYSMLLQSIKKLYADGKDYEIYPGHGDPSSLFAELYSNPYLQDLRGKL